MGKYFGDKFNFEEIACHIQIVEEQQPDYLLFKVEWKVSPDWVCTGLPRNYMSWWGNPYLVKGD